MPAACTRNPFHQTFVPLEAAKQCQHSPAKCSKSSFPGQAGYTLKMETAGFSTKLENIYQITWHNFIKGDNFRN
jgi:hypothetical protein